MYGVLALTAVCRWEQPSFDAVRKIVSNGLFVSNQFLFNWEIDSYTRWMMPEKRYG